MYTEHFPSNEPGTTYCSPHNLKCSLKEVLEKEKHDVKYLRINSTHTNVIMILDPSEGNSGLQREPQGTSQVGTTNLNKSIFFCQRLNLFQEI